MFNMKRLLIALLLLWIVFICSAVRKRAVGMSSRIFGGSGAFKGQFPYQASYYIDGVLQCGGSIIHKRWVLTAAHCQSRDPSADVYVIVGTIYRHGMDGQKISIEKFIPHEEFKIVFNQTTFRGGIANDIALIRLSEDIIFNDFVKPIKLAKDSKNTYENVTATVSGLGKTEKLNGAHVLQYLRVQVISDKECEETWAKLWTIIFKGCICASVTDERGFCDGDSGGPLVFKKELIGIVQSGYDCAAPVPNIYTRVSSYVPWINRQLNPYSDILPQF